MAVKTTKAQLEEVQAAITKVMSAQAGALGDKSLQRAKLEALSAREEMLLKRYKAEQGTGGIPAINIAIPKRL